MNREILFKAKTCVADMRYIHHAGINQTEVIGNILTTQNYWRVHNDVFNRRQKAPIHGA